jgi:EAL domain-containing protein (putative c-di-GMP-specific phosphodiesterase class I)
MYTAKQAQSGLSVYDHKQAQTCIHRFTLRGELRRAIENDELFLVYQPKIDLKRGSVCGVEALIRWRHPQRGVLGPNEFIPFAEHTELIKPLTRWVINKALSQHAEWRKAGIKISISVNLSARNLQDPQLPEEIERLLKEWNVEPYYLELEITESAMMADPAEAMDILSRLHKTGIRLSIDDFGTGFSSLAYLKRMSVDEIKIDRSFVMHMYENEGDAAIVRSTIELGHNLGLKVMAEGVERKEIWNILKTLGCDRAQGFHISRPLPPAEFMEWLNKSSWKVEE